MKILYWYYKSRMNKKGVAPIRMRITIDGERADLTTGIEIQEEKWDTEEQRVKGIDELTNEYNNTLITLRTLAWECYNHNRRNSYPNNAEIIKSYILAKDKPNYTLVDALDYQIANLKARVGNDVAALTVKKYETIKRKILDYLNKRLKRKDFLLNELSNKFIFDFDNYLRTEGKLGHNAVAKNMQQFRRVIKVAVQNEWIPKDPFTNYRCSPKETERGFLSIEEVQSLEAITLTGRLDKVRDLFLFCCYTGLAYADVSKLNEQHLMNGEDGNTLLGI